MTAPLVLHLRHLHRLGPDADDAELLRRFQSRSDGEAFTALVKRHGPMVLGVCRRLLGDAHAAEDAFQATFVVLARRAAGLRPAPLAGWLYGVARRVARKARRTSAKPASLPDVAAPGRDPLEEISARELLTILDEELHRLPERERLPLVLCALDGRTVPEAARLLATTPGAVRGRLERGRQRLHQRLTRRGLTVPAGVAALLAAPATGTAVAPRLIEAAAKATQGAPPPPVAALAQGGIRLSVAPRMALLTGAILTTSVLAAGAAWFPRGVLDSPIIPPADPPQAERRDRFNDPLPPGAVARLGTVSFRHGPMRMTPQPYLTFGPGGRVLISADQGAIRCWDAATGQERWAVTAPPEPGNMIDSATLTADGTTLVSVHGTPDGGATVRLWDAATGQERRQFALANHTVNRFRARSIHTPATLAAPDGRALAVQDEAGELHLWDVATGRETHHLREPSGPVQGFAFTPDGRTLVVAHADGNLRLLEVATGRERKQFPGPAGLVARFRVSPNGRLLATVGSTARDGGGGVRYFEHETRVRLWDLERGAELRSFDPTPADKADWRLFGVSPVAFTPDGTGLFVSWGALRPDGSPGGDLALWDVAAGRLVRRFPEAAAKQAGVSAAAVAPDGRTLATGTWDGLLRLWDVATGRDLRPPEGPVGSVDWARFLGDGRTVVARHNFREIWRWDATNSRPLGRVTGGGAYLRSLAVTADGRLLARMGEGKTPAVWLCDGVTGRVLHELPGHPKGDVSFAFSGDGTRLATGGADGTLRLWDPANGKELTAWPAGQPQIRPIAFAPDGKRLLVTTSDEAGAVWHVEVWDAAAGRRLKQWEPITAVGARGDVRIPGEINGQPIYQVQAQSSADMRRVSVQVTYGFREADGTSSWSGESRVAVCDAESGEVARLFDGFGRSLTCFALSQDGRLLASGHRDGTVVVWDAKTGERRQEFTGHRGQVFGLGFGPDGRRLVSGSEDGTALVWGIPGESK